MDKVLLFSTLTLMAFVVMYVNVKFWSLPKEERARLKKEYNEEHDRDLND